MFQRSAAFLAASASLALVGCQPEVPTGGSQVGAGSTTAGSGYEAGSEESGSGVAAVEGGAEALEFEPQVLKVSDAQATDKVVFNIPGMHCDFACSPKVRKAIAAVPGVVKIETQISTDEDKRKATIWTTEEFDEKQAIAAVEDVGYEVK